MTSWFWGRRQQGKPDKAQAETGSGRLGDGDEGFTHLSEAGPDNGVFALSECRERPDHADRGGSRVVRLRKSQYDASPQLAKGLKSCDLNHNSKDCDGKQAIDLELAIATDHKEVTIIQPSIQARKSDQTTQMIYDAEMAWMEAKQGAKDCLLMSTSFDLSKAEKQKEVTFPTSMETEVEIVHWIQDFRFSTEGEEPYVCDFWPSNVTSKGFTANADCSESAERLTVTWIVYKKGKAKVASGSFSTDDIEDRDDNDAQNSGRVEFAEGAFNKAPAVLVSLSQFDLAGGRDLRIGVRVGGISEKGFTWHLNTWGEHSEDALRSAEGTWIALGFA
ncbi:hypothetical protein LTR85_008536 [Meristemomyces frigidus]|nr:hypothetical protein LTR85_008536 [Meristemomyces frigidus]